MSKYPAIYISGPMTGHADCNFPAFNAKAAELRAQGRPVINPAEFGFIKGDDWSDCLRVDLTALMRCGAIHMLPGWRESKGACLERHCAIELGMRVEGAE